MISAEGKLAFTCGDPAGVGPEIIETWLRTHRGEAGDVAVDAGQEIIYAASGNGILAIRRLLGLPDVDSTG